MWKNAEKCGLFDLWREKKIPAIAAAHKTNSPKFSDQKNIAVHSSRKLLKAWQPLRQPGTDCRLSDYLPQIPSEIALLNATLSRNFSQLSMPDEKTPPNDPMKHTKSSNPSSNHTHEPQVTTMATTHYDHICVICKQTFKYKYANFISWTASLCGYLAYFVYGLHSFINWWNWLWYPWVVRSKYRNQFQKNCRISLRAKKRNGQI